MLPEILQARLDRQAIGLRKRTLIHRQGVDLSSNDYLGFSQDPILSERILDRLRDLPIGTAGSRLLRGNLKIHEEAETVLADFSGRGAALLFPSGYQANLGLISAILGPGDQVFSDELNHASLIDGIRLSRAEKFVYPHNNIEALRKALKEQSNQSASGLKVIITESLFSMNGDHAPLRELVCLAKEHSALLLVDESHATGLWGSGSEAAVNSSKTMGAPPGGGGLVQSMGLSNQVFATVHTGGKSMGCGGAWIACDAALKNYLINFSRPFIFSTAPSPALAVSLVESCKYWFEAGPERAQKVHNFSSELRTRLQDLQNNFPNRLFIPSGTGPIIPVILKDNARALSASQLLQSAGYDVRAIRPPTVPEGTARLRITANYLSANYLSANYTSEQSNFNLDHFINVLSDFVSSLR
ncbi:MAG: 8-amino-7-oxononanoate synthase [Bdellovibrionia bacterium]